MWGLITKLALPIFSGTTSIALRIFVVSALVGLGGFAWLTHHDGQIYKKAIDSCPPQIQNNGPTTIVQAGRIRCFPLAIGKWGIGICHD